MLKDVVLAGGARTAIGGFLGSLSTVPAPQLGGIAIKAALERARVAPDAVDEVIGGNVLPAGLGQNVTRQAAIAAGLPPADRRHHGQQGLRLEPQGGDAGRAGHPVRRRRGRRRRRHGKHVPSAVPPAEGAGRLSHGQRRDHRLDDPRRPVGRVQQSAHGHLRRPSARQNTTFPARSRTILPWPAIPGRSRRRSPAPRPGRSCRWKSPGRRGRPSLPLDEEPQRFNEEKLRALGPAFGKDGAVTAGNASSIADGAAAIVVLCRRKGRETGRQRPKPASSATAPIPRSPSGSPRPPSAPSPN